MFDGYTGLTAAMQTGFFGAYQPGNISITGEAPATLLLLGSKAWTQSVELNLTGAGPNVSMSFIGNIVCNSSWNRWVSDAIQPGALAAVAAAFDAFRELGAWDVSTYFPGGYGSTLPVSSRGA
jgi:hypothetical protein